MLNIFKKKFKRKDFDYTIKFVNNIVKYKEDDEPITKDDYVNYVHAKTISSDLKIRGTKYYIGKSQNKSNNFTIYLRCRYNKIGREYIREPLSDLLRMTFDCYSFKEFERDHQKEEFCKLNLLDVLSDHLDYIFEDVIDVEPFYKIYFSFKGIKDKNGNFVEGYVIFDDNTDSKLIEYLRDISKSTSLK